MKQGSPEWFEARAGKATASRIADITAKTRSGPAASRKNYLAELVAERLTGAKTDGYTNAAMQWGIDTEPEAREVYCFFRDVEVEEVGFIDHPSIDMTGASPDGLVNADGMVEIKCPNTATHIDTLLTQKVAKKYLYQMQWQMDCAGRDWCDFVSYDPRMPEHMRFFCTRIERDDELLMDLREEVTMFLKDVSAKIEELEKLYEEGR